MCKNCNNALFGIIYLPQTETTSFVPSFLCFLIIKKNVGRETLLIPDHYHYYVISLDTAENPNKKMKNENDDKVCNEKLHANLGKYFFFGGEKLPDCHVENFT